MSRLEGIFQSDDDLRSLTQGGRAQESVFRCPNGDHTNVVDVPADAERVYG